MERISKTPKAYIGTYAKYNNGSLDGAWMDLTKFASYDDFLSACYKLHKDEPDPELMCQDTEYMPEGISFPESFTNKDFDDVITAYKESLQEEQNEAVSNIRIVDYSEKSIAVYGDTKPIKDKLKALGGKFNRYLEEGAGWVFSKKLENKLRALLESGDIQTCNGKHSSKEQKYKEWFAEYCKLVNDSGYYSDRFYGAVKIKKDGNDYYYLIEKTSIDNDFWFYDEGPNYDLYLQVVRNDETKKEYFLRRNLEHYDYLRKCVKNGFVNFDSNHRDYLDKYEGEKIDDIAVILEAIEYGREKFEKRLMQYLKRWGVTKIKFGTFWADR